MKRSKHITLDDLPPKYRQQAEEQLKVWKTPDTLKWDDPPLEYIEKTKDYFAKEMEAHPGDIDVKKIAAAADRAVSLLATGKDSLQVRKDRKPKGPNKTEQLFNREMLGGLGQYEAVTLRLPGGSKYTGDWLTSVFDPQEQRYETTVYEVKCPYRHASHGRALTAFREARAAFPFLTFKWYEKQKGGGWLERYKA